MKQHSSIWRRITHFQIQIDPTIVLFVHLVLTHHGLTLLFQKVVLTLKISTSSFMEKSEKNYHYDKANDKNNIEISVNTNTIKSEMFLQNNYEVDFRKDKSINSLLGFHNNLYTSGFHESENMVNILTITSTLVNIDIISGSYVNGSTPTHNLLVLSRCLSRV